MRTRRSWRNQDRLFKYLFCVDPKPQPTLEPSACCFNCAFFPKQGRNWQTCKRDGKRHYGTHFCEEGFAPNGGRGQSVLGREGVPMTRPTYTPEPYDEQIDCGMQSGKAASG